MEVLILIWGPGESGSAVVLNVSGAFDVELSGLQFSLFSNYPSESRHELCEILSETVLMAERGFSDEVCCLTENNCFIFSHQLLLSSLRSGETSPRYGSVVCDI